MRFVLALFIFFTLLPANAMRCTNSEGNFIVSSGDDMSDVAYKCGEPDSRFVPGLLVDEAVWVYLRKGEGAVYKVHFLLGRVSDIEFNRMN